MPAGPFVQDMPIGGGVDQHSDARKLEPGRLISCLNAAYFKGGKLGKRYGTTLQTVTAVSQGSATTLAAPMTLAARATEKLAIERSRLLSYSTGKSVWAAQDQVSEWTIRERGVAQGMGANLDGDIAISNAASMICYVWATNQRGGTFTGAMDMYAQLVDQATGDIVLGPTIMNTPGGLGTFASCPHVVLVGSTFVAMWSDQQGHIRARTCTVSGAAPYSWTAEVQIITDTVVSDGLDNATHVWDVAVSGSSFIVAYWNTSGSPNLLNIRMFNAALTAGNTALNIPSAGGSGLQALGCSVGPSGLWVVTNDVPGGTTSTCRVLLRDSTSLASLAPSFTVFTDATPDVAAQATVVETTGGAATVAWSQTNQNQTRTQCVQYAAGAITNTGLTRTLPRVILMSKAVASLGKTWALCANETAVSYNVGDVFRGTGFWMDLNSNDQTTVGLVPRPAAVWAPRTAVDGGWRGYATLCAVATDINGKLRTLAGRAPNIVTAQASYKARLGLFDLELTSDQSARQCVEAGGLTYITGGVPSYYDGQRVGECSFLQYPYVTTAGSTVGGGALALTSTYVYAVIFLTYDMQGNVHRSAPVIVTRATTGTQNTITLTISNLNVTTRMDAYNNVQKVAVEIYRTNANDGTALRRRTAERSDQGVTESSTGNMFVDPTALTFTYTDGAADSTLIGAPLLYTTGGILENVNPPSSRLVCQHRGRVVFSGCPNGKEIWCSKLITEAEAPGFTEGLILYVDDGGEITAIASMDDKLIVFKQDRIFFFTGNGPGDNGQGSDWSDPIKIASTVGSVTPYVLVTPMGVVFRSAIGLSLLTRDLQVQPFWGSPVEDHLANFPLTTGMMLHPTLPEIRILVSRAALGSQTAEPDTFGLLSLELRYDYRAEAWLPAGYLLDFDIVLGFAQVQSCAVLQGVPYYMNSHPSFWYEDSTHNLDGGNQYVATIIEVAPAASAGTQGYQAFHAATFVGDRYTDHDITILVSYGDQPYSPPRTFTAATSAAWASYQFGVSAPAGSSKTDRVRLRLQDAFVAGTKGIGRGFALSSIMLEVEDKPGLRRLPQTQTM